MKNKSWRTTLLGIVAIMLGLWSMHVTYIPNQSWYFNIVYVWTGQWALIAVGVMGLHARDHKAKDE